MKFTEGSFKQWGYDLALTEFGDQVFTWQQYDEIVEKKAEMLLMLHKKKLKKKARLSLKILLLTFSYNKF